MRLLLPLLLTACAPAAWESGPKGVPQLAEGETAADSQEGTPGPAPDPSDTDEDDPGDGESVPEDPAPCGVGADGALPASEADFIPQDVLHEDTRERCAGVLHATVAAADSTLEVVLEGWTGPAWLQVVGLDGTVLLDTTLEPGNAASLVAPQSGELLLSVQPVDPDAPAHSYALSTRCLADCRPTTRHPLVLMHGMAGDDAWIGVFDYFVGVEAALGAEGFLAVAPGVDAFNTVEARSAQWQSHLDELEAAGIGRRFVLIGHSQGGLDARYLAGALGDERVAGIVTVATPHRGTSVADIATGVLDASPLGGWAVDAVTELMATILGLGEAELTEQLRDLSSGSMAAFNAEVVDPPGLPIWSWAGRTCVRTDWACLGETEGEVTNAFFALTTRIVKWAEGDNDGLVSVQSAQWGEFLGVLPADHIDSVGIHDPTATAPLDHIGFYRDEAHRLAEEGL